ncbi:MAG: nucleotidyltransferase substrate binding protein [Pseudanabaenaceae cyanobacterium]
MPLLHDKHNFITFSFNYGRRSEDIRWIQRFSNFERSFLLLQDSLKIEQLSVLERAGLIQFFEMTFELSWKLLKDYEETEGLIVKTPREAIKQAFQSGLIANGHDWIDALQDRNLTAHTYNEAIAITVEAKIRGRYFQLLEEVYIYFKNKIATRGFL